VCLRISLYLQYGFISNVDHHGECRWLFCFQRAFRIVSKIMPKRKL
jgi:hypothetical protein